MDYVDWFDWMFGRHTDSWTRSRACLTTSGGGTQQTWVPCCHPLELNDSVEWPDGMSERHVGALADAEARKAYTEYYLQVDVQ